VNRGVSARRAAVAAGLIMVVCSACGSSSDSAAPSSGSTASDLAESPLTGLPAPAGPVLAVKIDNVAAARPQLGLDAADIVYVEPVEAGLTRLAAVYSSRLPDAVGPVRSARESDLELLRQFGTPAGQAARAGCTAGHGHGESSGAPDWAAFEPGVRRAR
jgi:hypothetical protein